MKTTIKTKTNIKTKERVAKRNSLAGNPVIEEWLAKTAYKPCKFDDLFSRGLYWFCQTLRMHEKYATFKRQDILILCRIPFQTGEARQFRIRTYDEIFNCLVAGQAFIITQSEEEYENTFLSPLAQEIVKVKAKANEQINEFIEASFRKRINSENPLTREADPFKTELVLLRGNFIVLNTNNEASDKSKDHDLINKQAADLLNRIDKPYIDYLPELSDGDRLVKKGSDNRRIITVKSFTRIEADIKCGLYLLDAFRKTAKILNKEDKTKGVDGKRRTRKDIIKQIICDITLAVFPEDEDSEKANKAEIKLSRKTYLAAIDRAIYRAEKLTEKAYTATNLIDFLPSA